MELRNKSDRLLWELQNVGPGTEHELAIETGYDRRFVSTRMSQLFDAGKVKRRPFHLGDKLRNGRDVVWLYYVDEECEAVIAKRRVRHAERDFDTPRQIRDQIVPMLDQQELTIPQMAKLMHVKTVQVKQAIGVLVQKRIVEMGAVAAVKRGGKLHYWRKVA